MYNSSRFAELPVATVLTGLIFKPATAKYRNTNEAFTRINTRKLLDSMSLPMGGGGSRQLKKSTTNGPSVKQ